MADLRDRVPQNAPGAYYVDASCIDCDPCRSTAPGIFARHDDSAWSFAARQAGTSEEIELAEEALRGCPVDAIGRDGAPRDRCARFDRRQGAPGSNRLFCTQDENHPPRSNRACRTRRTDFRTVEARRCPARRPGGDPVGRAAICPHQKAAGEASPGVRGAGFRVFLRGTAGRKLANGGAPSGGKRRKRLRKG